MARLELVGPDSGTNEVASIVRPDRNRAEDGELAVTHDQTFANPSLKAKTPFVKPPVYIDYGVRVHVGGSTFINRNCMIMDTPVADVVIGEGCNIGANCCIVGVTREFFSPNNNVPWLPGAVPVQPGGQTTNTPTHPDGKDTRLNGKTTPPHRSRAARRAPPEAEHRPASHHRRRRLDRCQRNNPVSPSRAAGPRRHPIPSVFFHPCTPPPYKIPLIRSTPHHPLSIPTYHQQLTTTHKKKRGNITIGSGAVIGACSLVTTNIPPLTLAYGSPARVVSLLSDIKPCSAAAAAAATTALTLEEALRLGNRLPLDLADDDDGPMTTAAGQEAGFDCGLVSTPTTTVGRRGVGRGGYVCEGDAGQERDGGVVVSSRRRVSVGSSAGSSSTVAVESLRGAGLGREREVRELLRERGRQHRVMRRFEVEALAVMTVVVALLVAFFLAGVYLGARRVLVFG